MRFTPDELLLDRARKLAAALPATRFLDRESLLLQVEQVIEAAELSAGPLPERNESWQLEALSRQSKLRCCVGRIESDINEKKAARKSLLTPDQENHVEDRR